MAGSVTQKLTDQFDSKYFVRVLVGGLLGIAFSLALGLSPFEGFLIVFYTFMIVQTNVGATVDTVFWMLWWAFIGVCLGIFFSVVFQPVIRSHPEGMWFPFTLLTIVSCFILPYGRLSRFAVMTAFFILVFAHQSNSPFLAILYRIGYIVAAMIIGIGVTYLVYPVKASSLLNEMLRQFINESIRMFEKLVHHYLNAKQPARKKVPDWHRTKWVEDILELRQVVNDTAAMTAHARKEGARKKQALFRGMTVGESRIVNFLAAFRRTSSNVTCQELRELTNDLVIEWSEAIKALLVEWKECISDGKKRGALPDFDALMEKTTKRLNENELLLKRAGIEELFPFFGMINTLSNFARDMTIIYNETVSK
ncbi:MAG: hypothetical protein S4CHLAM102_16320 [Chlamydiia bacterium]|nr:hypothetical protein [Chlamydiia bacterium]